MGFAITGYNTIMEHGPDHKSFTGPKRIFSGHFHKRQAQDNVIFIGNTFPMDYGDAGDDQRGMCFYDVAKNDVSFVNWEEAPSYHRVVLSDLTSGKCNFKAKARVHCTVDTEISYTEAQAIRETMIESYQLREFQLEEDRKLKRELLEEDNADGVDFGEITSVDDLVVKSLQTIESDVSSGIDPEFLVEIYKNIQQK
jgi:hypothetical protein